MPVFKVNIFIIKTAFVVNQSSTENKNKMRKIGKRCSLLNDNGILGFLGVQTIFLIFFLSLFSADGVRCTRIIIRYKAVCCRDLSCGKSIRE